MTEPSTYYSELLSATDKGTNPTGSYCNSGAFFSFDRFLEQDSDCPAGYSNYNTEDNAGFGN